VFGEVRGHFAFELRGFRLDEEWLSFYIKPMDGLQLPAIMQWVKQTFAVRFNRCEERTGHIWGDRYWSRVVEGEPPEEAGEVDWEAVEVAAETGESPFGACPSDGVSPLNGGNHGGKRIFAPQPRPPPASARLSPKPGPKPCGNIDLNLLHNAVRKQWRERSARYPTELP
jgi:hypothetical protein